MAHVVSVQVGRPQPVDTGRRTVRTAIWKQRVEGSVAARGTNLEGDEQADRRIHGGYDKAVYAYASEDIAWWSQQLGRELAPGAFGENLTTAGLDLAASIVGERWRVGTVLLEVSEPRLPCFKLGLRMGDKRFVRRFAQAGRYGTYLRIVEEGELAGGDAIEVVSRPAHGVTTKLVGDAYVGERGLAGRVLEAADDLSPEWREWARSCSA